MLLQQILYFLFVHISLLVPGYVVIRQSKLLRKNPGVELGIAYAITLAAYCLLACITYALKLNELLPQVLFWVSLLLSLYVFINKRLYKELRIHLFPLFSLVIMSTFSLAFIGLSFSKPFSITPDPEIRTDRNYNVLNVKVLNVAQTGANDNYIPYRQAQFFINRSDPAKDSFIGEWGVGFFQRTPLMGAVSAQYFTAFNDSLPIGYIWSGESVDPDRTYVKFQIIAQILNSLFILPAFYLLTKLFNRRTALLSILFIIPSQFFLYNSFFSWPKSLTAFFILLSWLLLFEKRLRYVVLAGLASGLAYLTHDLAVLYIGASFVFLLYQRRFKHSAILLALVGIFMIPWLFISSVIYKKTSSFLLYPISTKGIPQPAEKAIILREFLETSPLRLIQIRLESLFYLLGPYQLIYSEGGQALARRFWALGLYSVPGSLGIGLIIPALLGTLKKIRNISLWILCLLPIILSTVIMGWPKGYGSLHFAEASVVLLVGVACYWLQALKSSIWVILAYALSSAQLFFFISYSFSNEINTWLYTPGDIVRIVIMACVVLTCGIGAYLVKSSPTGKLRKL